MRRIIFSFVTVALALMVTLAVGEAVLRVLYLFKPVSNVSMSLDHDLGWRYSPSVRRISGDANTRKVKVLVIGDSFTMAADIPSDGTYYSVLQKRFAIEVFAYGSGGYGSLQEFMVLDKVIDVVQPSLIIWQYCNNDFINNSYELESRSYLNNNGLRRPYLSASGEIVYAVPGWLPWLHATGSQHSRLIYFVVSRLDKLRAALIQTGLGQILLGPTVEHEIAADGKRHPGFQRASSITFDIMKRVRHRSAQTPIIAFSVDDVSPYYEEFRRISLLNDISFIDGIPEAIRNAEKKGLQTKQQDHAHWNVNGHRIAGEVIAAYLAHNYFGGHTAAGSRQLAASGSQSVNKTLQVKDK